MDTSHLPWNSGLLANHRMYVGSEDYERSSRYICGRLLAWGLRQHMTCLDIGCGSLRNGRWLIAFLDAGCYYGLEPEREMVDAGRQHELVPGLEELKRPTFVYRSDFDATAAGVPHVDFAFAWNVFNHLGPLQLCECLAGVRASVLVLNVNTGSESAERPKERAGWSYRFASHQGYRHAEADFPQLCRNHGWDAAYVEDVPVRPDKPPQWGASRVYRLTPMQ